jgi:spermidine/putrescine transport system ATP-binding protein
VRTVFQNYALFPHMTVQGNIAFPLKMAKTPPGEIRGKVAEALAGVRLAEFAARFPHELSGGQRQRVAIARALVTHPTLLLLDEPLAALDAKLREEMQIELINLQKQVGITFIYVTHDQTEALALSHRIAVMNKGRVEQIDEPDRLYGLPKTRFVADFIGTCNLLTGTVANAGANAVTLDVKNLGAVRVALDGPGAARVARGSEGAVALRPEKVRLHAPGSAAPADNRFAGVVTGFLYQGDVTVYMVRSAGGLTLEALLANSGSGLAKFFEVGDAVEMSWPADAGHYLAD